MTTFYLTITRRQSTDFGTPGFAVLTDGHGDVLMQMDTLELPWRGNRKMVSCIKADAYPAHRYQSGVFKRLLWKLEDRHGRGDCAIHNGVFAGDTTKTFVTHTGTAAPGQTHVHGCTLVGREYGDVPINWTDPSAPKQWGIHRGKDTLNEFMKATAPADELLVTYTWDEGCAPEDDV